MLNNLKNFYLNSKGFKSSRKIIVIESDDWGSVRMPSKQAYLNLLNAGIKVDQCGYNRFDSLETSEDLDAIYQSFRNIKDKNGNNPIITANTIVANPDYEKIKKDSYDNYYFETFVESYKRLQGNGKTLEMIKCGMKEKIFFPQLHGREHIFIDNWLNTLKNGDVETRLAFDNQVYGLSTTITTSKRKSFLTALDANNLDELDKHQLILEEAQSIFEENFKFTSKSFIAPNYTWHPKHELFLKKIGIDIIQGARAQKVPGNLEGYDTIKHFMGKKNELGQLYLTRNSSFEPSTRNNINWYQKIQSEVKAAFLFGAPVILSSHRVNFMGGMDEKNRDNNLKLLGNILTDLVKKYPYLEFMNTVELANHIRNSKNEK
jgi:hypothetical protein